MGFPTDKGNRKFKPTLVDSLNELKMKAKKVAVSEYHSLCLFENESGKDVLYSIGKSHWKALGVTTDELGNDE